MITKHILLITFLNEPGIFWGWLTVWILWHINLCRLSNAKSIFIQIIGYISNDSVKYEYTV